MTLPMGLHWGRTQWTAPADVKDLMLALAGGGFDDWSGRFVRAGVDTPESLRLQVGLGMVDDARAVRLRPWCARTSG